MNTLRWRNALLAASAALIIPLGHGAQAFAASQSGDQETIPAVAQRDAIVPQQVQDRLLDAIEPAVRALFGATLSAAAYCPRAGELAAEALRLVQNAWQRAGARPLTRNEAQAITDPLSQARSRIDAALRAAGPGTDCGTSELTFARSKVEEAADIANRAGVGG